VWIARGDPIAAGSPFGLLAQLVRSAAGIREGEPLEERRAKLLARIGVLGDEGRAIAAHLGGIARTPFEDASVPDDPKLRGDAMRDAFLRWMGAELARGPVVIVLDDLQWGDRPSVTFVATALRELRDRPLCVIAAARPEGEPYGEVLEQGEAQHVRLARLTPRAAEELARSVLDAGASDALIARVVERAEGNPFFLEELLRAVMDGQGDGALPATVLGMVEARLGVLEASTRRVLRAASVFGRRFWSGGVIALRNACSI